MPLSFILVLSYIIAILSDTPVNYEISVFVSDSEKAQSEGGLLVHLTGKDGKISVMLKGPLTRGQGFYGKSSNKNIGPLRQLAAQIDPATAGQKDDLRLTGMVVRANEEVIGEYNNANGIYITTKIQKLPLTPLGRTCKPSLPAVPIKSNLKNLINPLIQSKQIWNVTHDNAFTVYVECSRRAPIRFEYIAQKDCGKTNRLPTFTLDPMCPLDCQQYSGLSYGPVYDRGHLVPANHMDNFPYAIQASNWMTNIAPQTVELNRGAWLASEELIECLRDLEPLRVIGGAVWPAKDFDEQPLIDSHGVKIPVAFWKIVRARTLHPEDNNLISWWMPNTQEAVRDNVNNYIVSISEIEERLTDSSFSVTLKEVFDLPKQIKDHRARPWAIPSKCDKS